MRTKHADPASRPIWVIRMGKPGRQHVPEALDDAERLHRDGYIAIGWHGSGDLSELDSMEAFRDRVRHVYRHEADSNARVGASAGQLRAFVQDMERGDIVIAPSPKGRTLHIGEITSDYLHDPSLSRHYDNLREVRWIMEIERHNLDDKSRNALKPVRSLFRLGYDVEFRNLVGSRTVD